MATHDSQDELAPRGDVLPAHRHPYGQLPELVLDLLQAAMLYVFVDR